MTLLVDYPWPVNVRELENTIERAAVLCVGDRVDVASLPDKVAGVPAPDSNGAHLLANDATRPGESDQGADSAADLSIKRASREIEDNLIRRALARTGGNRVRAAELLEISHRALLYKIKDYGIEVAPARRPAATKPAAASKRRSGTA